MREEKLVRRRTGRPAEGEPPDGAAKMQADAEPSQQTGHEGREVVDAFKHYLIPGNLYNDLADRAKAKVYAMSWISLPSPSHSLLLIDMRPTPVNMKKLTRFPVRSSAMRAASVFQLLASISCC